MITFILNDKLIKTDAHPGTTLLDFIRYGQELPGTKIGCREGDCGACTVMEGKLRNGKVQYKSIVSCLTPLGNAHGKHIVTIEGINMKELSPVQSAIVENSGTQCGFCTPGFIMSLTCHCLEEKPSDKNSAIDAISGNICRCTGYKSIEKAAESISGLMKDKNINNPISWLVDKNYLPEYFLSIPKQLGGISKAENSIKKGKKIIGGGTDLMVQKPEAIAESELNLLFDNDEMTGVFAEKNNCIIQASTTANMIMNSELMQSIIQEIKGFFKLVSSEPIRNMGTIAGNIVNASPIADLTMFFLALKAQLSISDSKSTRTIALKDFYLGYKKLDLKPEEFIQDVFFKIPEKPYHFNFEKVSKRTYLDIASVNTVLYLKEKNDIIEDCAISIGGVSPIPLFLNETSKFLIGKAVENDTIIAAEKILQQEISPISDVRGSDKYKRLLARQLFFAHFIKLFTKKVSVKELLS
ncbi:MAG: FAD binding domain-containing protein [Bacteroidetes bacterium]|nr:FAD binding domain-containing protein [Bacteroidota bacterium]